MLTASIYVRVWGQSGKHMLGLSSSQFDPTQTRIASPGNAAFTCMLAGGGLQIEGIGSVYFLVFAAIFRHHFMLPQRADWNMAFAFRLGPALLPGLCIAGPLHRP